MNKFIGGGLYWLAWLAGCVGLVAGGRSLGRYVFARFNDPYFDSFSYNDLAFSGGVIFLLSLILLLFAELARSLGGAFLSAKPEKPGSLPKLTIPAAPSLASAAQTPAPEAAADRESADEKLARLLKQKNE